MILIDTKEVALIIKNQIKLADIFIESENEQTGIKTLAKELSRWFSNIDSSFNKDEFLKICGIKI